MRVIIIGGGWAGTAAAIAARKAGAEVCLIEKTDMLLGCGNAGGIMRNNGRFTAAEEMGIDVRCSTHICDVACNNNRLEGVYSDSGDLFEGDVFIETTGSAGPMGNCLKYGNGCCMCVLRCPAFGPRISITERCGGQDYQGERQPDMFGVFSGSCKVSKESLSAALQEELNSKGVALIPLPKEEINYDKLKIKACKQYAIKEFSENMILLDTGDAKLMTSSYPIEKLRRLPGMENARYVDPCAGSKGNSIRYLSVAYRSNTMTVDGISNLLCAGEKSGLFIGHTEAITTGTLAGNNAARLAAAKPLLTLPQTLAVGDLIAAANSAIKERHDTMERFTFSGGNYFNRMKEKQLYTTDIDAIRQRVDQAGLLGVFNEHV